MQNVKENGANSQIASNYFKVKPHFLNPHLMNRLAEEQGIEVPLRINENLR